MRIVGHNSKMARGKKKYAMIWCLRSRKYFVVALSSILIKNRVIGNIFHFHKKETKLVEISGKYIYLTSSQGSDPKHGYIKEIYFLGNTYICNLSSNVFFN